MRKEAAEFQKFYDERADDYIFPLEQLPLALKRIELEEKLEQERLSIELENERLTKLDITKKYLPPEMLDSRSHVGYFSELDCTFKANSDEVKKHYILKTTALLQECHESTLNRKSKH